MTKIEITKKELRDQLHEWMNFDFDELWKKLSKIPTKYYAEFDNEYSNIWWICDKEFHAKHGYFDDSMRDEIEGMHNVEEAGYEPIEMSHLETKKHLQSIGLEVQACDIELAQADLIETFEKSLQGMEYEDAKDHGKHYNFIVMSWDEMYPPDRKSDDKIYEGHVDFHVSVDKKGIIK